MFLRCTITQYDSTQGDTIINLDSIKSIRADPSDPAKCQVVTMADILIVADHSYADLVAAIQPADATGL